MSRSVFRASSAMMAAAAVFAHAWLLPAWAQGTVLFANFDPLGRIDAPVTYLDGTRVGPEFRGQIFAGPAGTPVAELQPYGSPVPFESGEARGYVFGGRVELPGLELEPATIVVRAFNGLSWEESICRGESDPLTMTLSVGQDPEKPLIGLEPFTVNCIPEPGILVLAGLGAAALGLRWRRRRS